MGSSEVKTDSLKIDEATGISGSGADDRITRWNGTDAVQSSDVILNDSGGVVPAADLTQNLGGTSNRWSTLYINSLDAGSSSSINLTSNDQNIALTATSGGVEIDALEGFFDASGGGDLAISTSGGGALSLETTGGSIAWIDGSEGTAGQVLVSQDTSGVGAWAAVPTDATKADTDLGNLSSPTAFNQHLIPASGSTYDLATSATRMRTVYTDTLRATIIDSPATGNDLSIRASRTSPLGGDSMAVFGNSSYTKIAIFTRENTAADAQDTGDLELVTGSITNAGASGNCGDLVLQPGTNAGSGADGTIAFNGEISTDILFSGASLDVGSSSQPAATVYTSTLRADIADFPSSGNDLTIRGSHTSPLGSGRLGMFGNTSFNQVTVYSKENTAADAQDTGALELLSGSITNAGASGNCGDIIIQPGTNSGSGADGIVDINGDVDISKDLTIGQFIQFTKQTVGLIADDTAVAPTSSYIGISSDTGTATDRTFTIDIQAAGTQITLVWENANAGELLDSGIHQLAGDWTPGQYDSITLLSDGTNWVEVCRSDN